MSKTKRTSPEKSEQGKPSKKQQRSNKAEEALIEHGHVYIFYRRKMDTEQAEDLEDVRRLYFITIPEYAKDDQLGRRVAGRVFAIPKKRFPDVDSHDRFSCFVDGTFQTLEDARDYLKETHYATKTRGERVNPKATLVGAGVYGISFHSGHSHLILSLDESSKDQVEQIWPEFGLRATGSYIMQVKSPEAPTPAGMPSQGADFPQDLAQKFGDKKWIPVETTGLLNYERCQLLLIGARENVIEELGKPAKEVVRHEDKEFPAEADETAKVAMQELKAKASDVTLGPLYGVFQ